METEAGRSPWTPPVTGEQEYNVELRSLAQDFDARVIEAEVRLKNRGK
jgi:hypothetical protein